MGFSVLDSIKKTIMVAPHPAGIPFIVGGAAVTVFLSIAGGEGVALVALVATLFCLYFFRDPVRTTPQKDTLVIAPADGIVSAITENVSLPAEVAEGHDERYTRISIFLSVLDVHVNRIPVSGKVTRKVYRPGRFLNADLDKASEDNERASVLIERADGKTVGVVQIAGLIARRIVNDLNEGMDVRAGARFGIIRFGSRTDVYVPLGTPALVCVGQRAVGGETVIAEIGSAEDARKGEVV